MALLGDHDRERVRAAILAAERRTAGELVTVVAPRAAHYLEFALLYALLAGAAVALGEPLWGGWGRPSALVASSLVEVAVALLLVGWPRLRVALVPPAVRRARCHALALQQFAARDVARTRGRTGVLLLVVADERHVEIVADAGIHGAVPEGFWAEVVGRFTVTVREGRIGDGFVDAIAAIGAALERHAPRAADDRDELPDHLIELGDGA